MEGESVVQRCTTHGSWAFYSILQRYMAHGSWEVVTLHGPWVMGKKSLKGVMGYASQQGLRLGGGGIRPHSGTPEVDRGRLQSNSGSGFIRVQGGL